MGGVVQMEIVKRVMKNNELSLFIGLFALFGFVEMGAMNVAPRTRLTPRQLKNQKDRFIKQAQKKWNHMCGIYVKREQQIALG